MNYAGRFNSFVFKGQTVYEAIDAYKQMRGITHLEFNYPEHFAGIDLEELKRRMTPLRVNGLAIRWRREWLRGNFTNDDPGLRRRAVQLAKDGCDVCRAIGGSVVTLWFENDGFEYAFQTDYETCWNLMVEGIREVCDYAPDLKISVEYKPYEEREFAMIDSTGMVMYLIDCVDRPNIGCTLDFCHMLMKHDLPAYGLALAASKGRLYGLHMNDGYGYKDSGMIFGSVNFSLCAEFVYYLERYGYNGVVFFDTFPIREESKAECQANLDVFELIKAKVDRVGKEEIARVVAEHDGIAAQRLITELMK
ncbi:MAG: TIM barrel protein [Clostridia bacterium]|nr:TIM barrel protein [Clostridia bacterium]